MYVWCITGLGAHVCMNMLRMCEDEFATAISLCVTWWGHPHVDTTMYIHTYMVHTHRTRTGHMSLSPLGTCHKP